MRLSYVLINNKMLCFQNARAYSSTKFHQVHFIEIFSSPAAGPSLFLVWLMFSSQRPVSSLKAHMVCWVGPQTPCSIGVLSDAQCHWALLMAISAQGGTSHLMSLCWNPMLNILTFLWELKLVLCRELIGVMLCTCWMCLEQKVAFSQTVLGSALTLNVFMSHFLPTVSLWIIM